MSQNLQDIMANLEKSTQSASENIKKAEQNALQQHETNLKNLLKERDENISKELLFATTRMMKEVEDAMKLHLTRVNDLVDRPLREVRTMVQAMEEFHNFQTQMIIERTHKEIEGEVNQTLHTLNLNIKKIQEVRDQMVMVLETETELWQEDVKNWRNEEIRQSAKLAKKFMTVTVIAVVLSVMIGTGLGVVLSKYYLI